MLFVYDGTDKACYFVYVELLHQKNVSIKEFSNQRLL